MNPQGADEFHDRAERAVERAYFLEGLFKIEIWVFPYGDTWDNRPWCAQVIYSEDLEVLSRIICSNLSIYDAVFIGYVSFEPTTTGADVFELMNQSSSYETETGTRYSMAFSDENGTVV